MQRLGVPLKAEGRTERFGSEATATKSRRMTSQTFTSCLQTASLSAIAAPSHPPAPTQAPSRSTPRAFLARRGRCHANKSDALQGNRERRASGGRRARHASRTAALRALVAQSAPSDRRAGVALKPRRGCFPLRAGVSHDPLSSRCTSKPAIAGSAAGRIAGSQVCTEAFRRKVSCSDTSHSLLRHSKKGLVPRRFPRVPVNL